MIRILGMALLVIGMVTGVNLIFTMLNIKELETTLLNAKIITQAIVLVVSISVGIKTFKK